MVSNFTIFDVETNGLSPKSHSVLSFSALYLNTWRSNGSRHFQVQEEFDRYYYPTEPYNPRAIRVNGLTADVINERRRHSRENYPLHFSEDREVPIFCQQTDLAVCHNTPFDAKFLKYTHAREFSRLFCTMRNLTQYCAIPHRFYGIKWPKLEEAVRIVCGREDFAFHDSLADCYAVLEILIVMANSRDPCGEYRWSDMFDELFLQA